MLTSSMMAAAAAGMSTLMALSQSMREEEKQARKKSNEMFNSITEKVKPENQNQTHNSRREGMGPNTKRKPC